MKTNKLIKAVATVALAATMSFTTLAVPASAAWQTTDSGKQWINSDGSIAKSKWLKMKNGDRYYIKSNGLMATGLLTITEKIDGKKVKSRYYFGKQGKMQTGWQYVNKQYYYFDTETGKAYTGSQKLSGYVLKFDEKGVWDQKLYNSKGTDVTTDALIEKVTGFAVKKDTVIIAGQEYKTNITEILINKEGVTDEELENLKYLTKLKKLVIVPGATHINGADAIKYDYKDVKAVGTKTYKNNQVVYTYEFTAVIRKTTTEITNLDFCAYMPNLEDLEIAYATKLTDISGLSKLTKLYYVNFVNCTALRNLNDLSTSNFVSSFSGISVYFTTDVNYAFTDKHYGSRIKTSSASLKVIQPMYKCEHFTSKEIPDEIDVDYSMYLAPGGLLDNPDDIIKSVVYSNGKLVENTLGV